MFSPKPLQRTTTSNASAVPVASKVASLANELMNARTSIHKLHLKITGAGSYAAHKALNELYDALPDHADNLVEGFQGASLSLLDLPDTTPVKLNSVNDAISFLNTLTASVSAVQAILPYSEIINELDTVKSTLDSARYKLKFLS